MKKVALIIIYNHQYNKNIDVLERIYQERFSDIYHLVPFYNGDKLNVIPVYENSFYFQGYVNQGFNDFFKDDYDHYFFVADDLFLNPIINEDNYAEHLSLNSTSCFIPGLLNLHEFEDWWPRIAEAHSWSIKCCGVEAESQLPEYKEALSKFRQFDLTIKPLNFDQIWEKPKSMKEFVKKCLRDRIYFQLFLKNRMMKKQYSLSYPIVGSYSDIFVVSADAIKQFSHYCGVFASTRLFVELGIPTSLVLSAKEIVSEKDLKLQGRALWPKIYYNLQGNGKTFWEDEDCKVLDKYEYSLDKLTSNFPEGYMYLHPVKLSKWKK